jgi:hypothetical protein
MVQILPEPTLAHGFRQVLVRGTDDPHVDGLGASTSEATHHAVRDCLEELRLKRWAEQPDFIQK